MSLCTRQGSIFAEQMLKTENSPKESYFEALAAIHNLEWMTFS